MNKYTIVIPSELVFIGDYDEVWGNDWCGIAYFLIHPKNAAMWYHWFGGFGYTGESASILPRSYGMSAGAGGMFRPSPSNGGTVGEPITLITFGVLGAVALFGIAMTWTYRNEIAEGILQISEAVRGTGELIRAKTLEAMADLMKAAITAFTTAIGYRELRKPSKPYYVYFGMEWQTVNGAQVEWPVYVGITNNLKVRYNKHNNAWNKKYGVDRFSRLQEITYGPLTKNEAHAIEQLIIVKNPQFQNLRNSIDRLRLLYPPAALFAMTYLETNGWYNYYKRQDMVN